ncbi:peptide chain release factor 1 [Acidisoma sp. C75]
MGLVKRSVGAQLEEVERILNDPTRPMEAHRVWSLLDDIAARLGRGGEVLPGAPAAES